MTSIARRLGLWMILGGGAFIAALFVVIDSMVDAQLYRRFDAALVERARDLAARIAARDAAGHEIVDGWPEFAATRHEDFYQVWDERAVTVARAASSRGRDLARPTRAPDAEPMLFNLVLPDGHRGRGVYMAAWRPGAARPWSVVLAREREAVDALERRIHLVLSYGALAALALMFVLSLAAVRAGLAPLRRFGEDAARRAVAGRALPAAAVEPLPAELVPIGKSLDRAFGALNDALVREQRFARAVAHELRTPLAEMAAVVDSLDAASGGAAGAALRASLAGMTRTVDGLIALARYEAGIETPAIEPVELVAMLSRLRSARRDDIAARALDFACDLPPELWVSTDAALIERILANLVGNAVDHAPAGSRVALRARAADGMAQVAVGNAAPGLAQADLPHLGERCAQLAGTARDRNHAGLGLALSAAIAAQLGLALTFELAGGVLQARLHGLRAI
ncbi:MAG: sensor histidine kinase [Gammaproteobacteria bacterium]